MNLVLNLSRYFFEFERKYFHEISNNRIDDKIAWYILKMPLFLHIYHDTVNTNVQTGIDTQKSSGIGRRKIMRTGKFFFLFWKNWFHTVRKSKTHKTIVIALTVDKRLKGRKYKNVLFDELILDGIIKDPLVLTISKEGELLEPSQVPSDIYLDHLSHVITLISKTTKSRYRANESLSVVYQLILRFLEEHNIGIKLDLDWVLSKYAYHVVEHKVYKKFFRRLRPKTLVVTDQSFSGKIRAANDLGIPVFEYQHGLMDEHYPPYTLPLEYKSFKKHLILEDKIVVFGEFHRQQILKHQFWNEEDVVVTGNVQINEVRRDLEQFTDEHRKLNVLFPTQGRYSFNNTMRVVEQLKELDSNMVQLIIRPHPLEPEDCLIHYRQLAGTSRVFNLMEDKVSIFNLISRSDIVLGFDSTTLLEAIAVGKPAITIASSEFPKGIHSMLKNKILEDVIRVMVLEERKLVTFLHELASNRQLLTEWKAKSFQLGNFLYDKQYLENSRALFDQTEAN